MVKHKAWAATIVAPKLDRERTDAADFQGDFNGPERTFKARPRTHDRIQYSNRRDLQKKSRKENSTVGTPDPPLNLRRSRARATRFEKLKKIIVF